MLHLKTDSGSCTVEGDLKVSQLLAYKPGDLVWRSAYFLTDRAMTGVAESTPKVLLTVADRGSTELLEERKNEQEIVSGAIDAEMNEDEVQEVNPDQAGLDASGAADAFNLSDS